MGFFRLSGGQSCLWSRNTCPVAVDRVLFNGPTATVSKRCRGRPDDALPSSRRSSPMAAAPYSRFLRSKPAPVTWRPRSSSAAMFGGLIVLLDRRIVERTPCRTTPSPRAAPPVRDRPWCPARRGLRRQSSMTLRSAQREVRPLSAGATASRRDRRKTRHQRASTTFVSKRSDRRARERPGRKIGFPARPFKCTHKKFRLSRTKPATGATSLVRSQRRSRATTARLRYRSDPAVAATPAKRSNRTGRR